jgi:hypothetical protein
MSECHIPIRLIRTWDLSRGKSLRSQWYSSSVLIVEGSGEIVAELDSDQVQSSLKLLSSAHVDLFGADWHHFVLNPPLSDREIISFETLHSISLPTDYRHFVSHIGNGGAGPYYGVFPFGQMDDNYELKSWHEGDGFVGVLSEPFALRDAWNDLTRKPSEKLIETNLEEYDRQLATFEKIYWSPVRTNGAFPICHIGCALRIWLIVSGGEAGHLWLDGRADNTGLSPLTLKDKSLATFSSWYQEWLDSALEALH